MGRHELPHGWEKHRTKDSKVFYYDIIEDQAQWDHPNKAPHKQQVKFQNEIARMVLVAQYYGGIKLALQRSTIKPARIFLMPLGGGVFNNPVDLIVGAMSTAIDMLMQDGIDVVNHINIFALGWKGSTYECHDLSVALQKCG